MISLPKAFTGALDKMVKQITELVAAVDNLAVTLDETNKTLEKLSKNGGK